ncbi:hypothetical protein H2198_007637, partial [Neophaeococcomyces mojaviensis]
MWPDPLSHRLKRSKSKNAFAWFGQSNSRTKPEVVSKAGTFEASPYHLPNCSQTISTLQFVSDEKLQDAQILATPTDKDLDELVGKTREPAQPSPSAKPKTVFSLFGIEDKSGTPQTPTLALHRHANSSVADLSAPKRSLEAPELQAEPCSPSVRAGGISLRKYLNEISRIGSSVDPLVGDECQNIFAIASPRAISSGGEVMTRESSASCAVRVGDWQQRESQATHSPKPENVSAPEMAEACHNNFRNGSPAKLEASELVSPALHKQSIAHDADLTDQHDEIIPSVLGDAGAINKDEVTPSSTVKSSPNRSQVKPLSRRA